MPKLFGNKKKANNDEGPEIKTEIDLEEKTTKIPTAVLIAAPLVVGGIAYLVGFKHGVEKGGTNVIYMKD